MGITSSINIKNIFDDNVFNVLISGLVDNYSLIKKNNFNSNNKHIFYNYICNPEEIYILEDNNINTIFYLNLNNEDINSNIYDIFGNKLVIEKVSELLKFKSEFYLYKDLINEESNSDLKELYKDTFFKKWYNL